MNIHSSNESGFFSQRNYDGPIVMTIEQVGLSKLSLLYSDPVTDLQLFRIPHRKIERKEISEIVGDSPAVYILVGSEPDDCAIDVYVGETGGTAQRVLLQASSPKNNFAQWLYVITSRSNQYNKVHMKFLEAKLTDLLNSLGLFNVLNTKNAMFPPSPYDGSLVERGYYIIMKLLSASGFPFAPETLVDAFATRELIDKQSIQKDDAAEKRLARVSYCIDPNVILKLETAMTNIPNVQGYGVLEDNGNFTILPGSVIHAEVKNRGKNDNNTDRLLREGEVARGMVIEPVTFTSIYVATKTLTGRAFYNAENCWYPTDDYDEDALLNELEEQAKRSSRASKALEDD